MSDLSNQNGYFTGQLLVAMPNLRDPRFTRSVIYMCVHNEEGAMGLVLNRLIGAISFPDLLRELELGEELIDCDPLPSIHFGGPVEEGRGFVLHSSEYLRPESLALTGGLALTATIEVLRDIADGVGPKKKMLALGYAGWGAGQLDIEIQENSWLSVPYDPELVFSDDLDQMWDKALSKIGIDASMLLSTEAGRA